MAYLDVITLAEAKEYLRVDDTLTADDARISSMIKAALGMIERYTSHYVYARSKSYNLYNNKVRVYDYPINTLISPTEAKATEKTLYTLYEHAPVDNEKLVLNVGYTSVDDVPNGLIEDALNLVKYMYFEAETDKANNGDLPIWLKMSLDQYKRFII